MRAVLDERTALDTGGAAILLRTRQTPEALAFFDYIGRTNTAVMLNAIGDFPVESLVSTQSADAPGDDTTVLLQERAGQRGRRRATQSADRVGLAVGTAAHLERALKDKPGVGQPAIRGVVYMELIALRTRLPGGDGAVVLTPVALIELTQILHL